MNESRVREKCANVGKLNFEIRDPCIASAPESTYGGVGCELTTRNIRANFCKEHFKYRVRLSIYITPETAINRLACIITMLTTNPRNVDYKRATTQD